MSTNYWQEVKKLNKNQFLENLNHLLKDIPENDRKEILFDYNEHFSIGQKEGRNEVEIANSLGNPKTIAKEVKAQYLINKAEETKSSGNILRAVLASIGLGFFNLVFILGPFLGIVGAVIGLFAGAIALIVSGLALFLGSFLQPVLPQFIHIAVHPIVSIFLSFVITSLGLLWTIGMVQLSKLIYTLTIKYLKVNLNIITDRRGKK